MIGLIIVLSIVIGLGFLLWFGLKRSTIAQRSKRFFRIITSLIIIVVTFITILAVAYYFENQAPSEPEITYGEFPFRLEYEIDGERFVIEDIVIAEFEGSFRGNVTTRPSRRWSTTLSHSERWENLSVGTRYTFLLKEFGDVRITFQPGEARYFLGDLTIAGGVPVVGDGPRVVIRNRNHTPRYTRVRVEDAHELLAEHDITLISWEYTLPIENVFR